MYKSNLVLAVKANGKVLREFDDTVYLPFGSEYSLLIKNLFNRRVRVKVKIDGQDALDGNSLVIDAKDDIDLRRFIKNGNLNSGNAFKFIEKTSKISQHRGDRAEDGLITLEYEFEMEVKAHLQGSHGVITSSGSYGNIDKAAPIPYNNAANWYYDPNNFYSDEGPAATNNYMAVVDASNTVTSSAYSTDAIQQTRRLIPKCPTPKNDAGITAPGSVQEQSFSKASFFFSDGVKHTITVQLKGVVEGQQEVQKPVTVTRLKFCEMCGTKVRQTAKFCHECGASVEIV